MESESVDWDWSKCLICQEWRAAETLKCPKKSFGEDDKLIIYRSFIQAVNKLRDAGIDLKHIPLKLPEHITAQSLFNNDGKW